MILLQQRLLKQVSALYNGSSAGFVKFKSLKFYEAIPFTMRSEITATNKSFVLMVFRLRSANEEVAFLPLSLQRVAQYIADDSEFVSIYIPVVINLHNICLFVEIRCLNKFLKILEKNGLHKSMEQAKYETIFYIFISMAKQKAEQIFLLFFCVISTTQYNNNAGK
uniref:Uncharacterized protein n=1 Tax=Romanomermis culicivorax TaxID=13658 RepID=A0A915HS23_ROMCU